MCRLLNFFTIALLFVGCGPSSETLDKDLSPRQFKWKLVTSWKPNSPINQEAVEQFAKDVRVMSRGLLDITVFAGGELVPPLQVFDAVSRGGVEMGHAASYYWAGKIPAAQFMTVVPFGLTQKGAWAWIYAGDGLKLWKELYQPFGVVPFPMGNTGIQMGGWFNKKIETIADLKGLRIRMPGLGGKVLSKAGANPVNIDPGELYMALERGVIDATEWVGPVFDRREGFDDVAKYYYFPGWHEPGSQLELIINSKVWGKLPEDLKLIIRSAAAKASLTIFARSEFENTAAFKEMKEENQVEIVEFPKEVLQQFEVFTRAVLEEEARENPQFKVVLESYQNFVKDYQEYEAVTESAYRRAVKE